LVFRICLGQECRAIDPDDAYAWFILCALILFGGTLIRFATQRRWGKFRWNNNSREALTE
jgi:hypothetical protein